MAMGSSGAKTAVDTPALAVSRLMLIDDDMISREIMAMLALESGFSVDAFESGEAALAWLARAGSPMPEAVLTDLQMPGVRGLQLAQALRQACPAGTPLVVMSGSPAEASITNAFDAFLLKPFSIETLDRTFAAVLSEAPLPHIVQSGTPQQIEEETEFFLHLERRTYQSLSRSMPPESLAALLTMCLDDSNKRLGTMQDAVAAADEPVYKRAAHAIKGGCATVGFRQLTALAAAMEVAGLASAQLEEVDDSSTPRQMIARFMDAATRLRVILNTHEDRAQT